MSMLGCISKESPPLPLFLAPLDHIWNIMSFWVLRYLKKLEKGSDYNSGQCGRGGLEDMRQGSESWPSSAKIIREDLITVFRKVVQCGGISNLKH